jgi:hypothetical protein
VKADELQQVSERVFFWEAFDPAVKTNLSSTAIRTASGLVIIDPVPLAKEALGELASEGPVSAIVLTSGNHARAGEAFRKSFEAPLWAHPEAVAELGLTPDRLVRAGDAIDDLRVYEIAGAAAGEIALHSAGTGLHFGDAVINVPPYGFAPLPFKYCLDEKAMHWALRALAALDFPLITFAHGTPLVTDPRRRFSQLLDALA